MKKKLTRKTPNVAANVVTIGLDKRSRRLFRELTKRVADVERSLAQDRQQKAAEVRLTGEELLSLRFFIAAIRGVHDGPRFLS